MGGRISYLGGIVRDGLVLDLDAAKIQSYPRTGTLWNDISGNQNNGTLVNGPTFNSANGGSIVFDGTNDYVNLGVFLTLTGQVTFNSWIKTSSTLGHLIGAYNNISPFPGWAVGFGFTSSGNLNWWSGGSWKSSAILCNTNSWLNVATIFDGTNVSFYSNGVFSTTTTAPTISSYIGNKFLGGRANDGATPFNGNIANTLIYNRALTATEVLQNYNAIRGRFGL